MPQFTPQALSWLSNVLEERALVIRSYWSTSKWTCL